MCFCWNYSYWISSYTRRTATARGGFRGTTDHLSASGNSEIFWQLQFFSALKLQGVKWWFKRKRSRFRRGWQKGRYEKGCIRTSPNRQVGGKKIRKEKVTAAVAYYGTKAVRDMQRPWVKAPVGGSHWFPLFESIGISTGASHMRRQQKKQFETSGAAATDRLWLLPNRPWRKKFDWVTAKWRPLHMRSGGSH